MKIENFKLLVVLLLALEVSTEKPKEEIKLIESFDQRRITSAEQASGKQIKEIEQIFAQINGQKKENKQVKLLKYTQSEASKIYG
jgi:hypothetical protein